MKVEINTRGSLLGVFSFCKRMFDIFSLWPGHEIFVICYLLEYAFKMPCIGKKVKALNSE